VEWETRLYDQEAALALGRSNCYKTDPSLKSFLFPLMNPHNIPAMKFALMAKKNAEAICCDNCDANPISHAYRLAQSYVNDIGRDGRTPIPSGKAV
jgi:hypothetical protein